MARRWRPDLRFARYDRRISIGVTPDGTLELETLQRGQLAVFKAMAAGDEVTHQNVTAAQEGRYDQVDDAAARTAAQAIVISAGGFTTDKLEK